MKTQTDFFNAIKASPFSDRFSEAGLKTLSSFLYRAHNSGLCDLNEIDEIMPIIEELPLSEALKEFECTNLVDLRDKNDSPVLSTKEHGFTNVDNVIIWCA